MEQWILVVLMLMFLGYLISEELGFVPPDILPPRAGRLCDYTAAGAVFQDIPTALKRGIRLLELHVFSDERDEPVVATKPFNDGSTIADENISFEQAMVDVVNEAFPADDPFILSIVPHTEKSFTLNRVAYHISTTVRRHLVDMKEDIITAPIEDLANKIVIVSGNVAGTELEKYVNVSWNGSFLRRLTHHQAVHPRDPTELAQFNRDRVTLVAPEAIFKNLKANPETPIAYGCQWNLFAEGPSGFVQKAFLAR
jgi:hypothetical protein